MKNRLAMATALAAGLALLPLSALLADENMRSIDDSARINDGGAHKMPSAAADIPRSTPDEALDAKMTPISTQPSTGENNQAQSQPAQPGAAGEAGQTGAAGQAAGSANQPGVTTGMNSNVSGAANGEPPPSGPIGAVGQTIPAKFSERNDVLDRTPIMAVPLPLDREQRQQVYQAVMADKTDAVPGADKLQPASQVPPEQALNDMHPLPESLKNVPALGGLKYLKGKDKVLLVTPATRIVVDQFKS